MKVKNTIMENVNAIKHLVDISTLSVQENITLEAVKSSNINILELGKHYLKQRTVKMIHKWSTFETPFGLIYKHKKIYHHLKNVKLMQWFNPNEFDNLVERYNHFLNNHTLLHHDDFNEKKFDKIYNKLGVENITDSKRGIHILEINFMFLNHYRHSLIMQHLQNLKELSQKISSENKIVTKIENVFNQ